MTLLRCAVVAFWYKPCSSHKHTYPAMKDADGNPVKVEDLKTETVDGEAQYKVFPFGIEIFRNK